MKIKCLFVLIILCTLFVFTSYAFLPKCYIKFSSKGGIGTMEKQECTKGENIRLNPCTYTKEGYYFRCWEDDFGRQYVDQDYMTVESDIHLYAIWSKTGDTDDPMIIKNSQDEKVILQIKEYQDLRGNEVLLFPNKWYTVGDNLWYYIDMDLKPQRGWHDEFDIKKHKTRWHYLDPDTCLMAIGWKVIDKKYYYFATSYIESDYIYDKVKNEFIPNGVDKELGQMYESEYTPDGRYVNNNGCMVN